MSTSLPPPGWHPDPQYPGYQRWWDGAQWSEHRAPLAAQPAGWQGPALATFGSRLGAFLIDMLALMVPMLLIMVGVFALMLGVMGVAFSNPEDTAVGAGFGIGVLVLLPVLFLAIYGMQILYAVGFEGGTLGQTPGKWLLGIRVVDARTASPTTPSKAFLRWLVRSFASGAILALGYLWMVWDDENRTWHDMAADTRVVEAPGPRVPFRELLRSWRVRTRR